jgi:hypothetical protein
MTGNLAGSSVPGNFPTPQPPLIPVAGGVPEIPPGAIAARHPRADVIAAVNVPLASMAAARTVPKPGPPAQPAPEWAPADRDRQSVDRSKKLTQIRTRLESVVHLLRSADYLGFHRLDADALDVAAVAADVAGKSIADLLRLIPEDDSDD